MTTQLHPADGFPPKRSRSQRLLERIRSASRGHEDKPESISASIAHAGLLSGSIGSSYIKHSKEVQKGAAAFLQELDRVASLPQTGIQRQGTLDVLDDAKSEKGVNPITDKDLIENPFEVQPDALAPVQNPEEVYDFTEDIYIINPDAKIFARALLDTGSSVNAIHAEKAIQTGCEIEPYTGPEIRDADGPYVKPIGQMKLQFHFRERMSARTWDVSFLVLQNPPFDVALGRVFISHACFFTWRDVMLPMEFKKLTPAEQKAKKESVEKREKISNETKKKQDDQYKGKSWGSSSKNDAGSSSAKKKYY